VAVVEVVGVTVVVDVVDDVIEEGFTVVVVDEPVLLCPELVKVKLVEVKFVF